MNCVHLHDQCPIIFTNTTFQGCLDTHSRHYPCFISIYKEAAALFPKETLAECHAHLLGISKQCRVSFSLARQFLQKCLFLFLFLFFSVWLSLFTSYTSCISRVTEADIYLIFQPWNEVVSMRDSFHKAFFKIFQMSKHCVAMHSTYLYELDQLTCLVKSNTKRIFLFPKDSDSSAKCCHQ